MTQKELLYLEDAIGHEKNIIKICETSIKDLQDENLISFLKKEIDEHVVLKERLMGVLEEKANEWSIDYG